MTGPMGERWHFWMGPYTGFVLGTTALVPLAILSVVLLTRWRTSAGSMPGRAFGRSLAEVGLVYGTVPWVVLTLLPGADVGASSGGVSLVPLRDLPTMSTLQVVGNLLVLAALGLFGPLRFPVLASLPRVTVLAAICSTAIEVAQYLFRLDRVSSVDDILLNTTGATIAAVLSWPWWRRHAPGVQPRRFADALER